MGKRTFEDVKKYVEWQSQGKCNVLSAKPEQHFNDLGVEVCVWNVKTDTDGDWWVVEGDSVPMNLYPQSAYYFGTDEVYSFHMGLMQRMSAAQDEYHPEDFVNGVTLGAEIAPQLFRKLKSVATLIDVAKEIEDFQAIVSAIVSVKKPIILLDEPEAFLHPPQALQLGEVISGLVESSQQIFIATHSADFLRGLLSSTRDAVIIHLDRTENITKANVLDSVTLNQIVTDPLLSSSRVLDGMFYKGVVATEADADAVFYQRLFQKIGAADEVHFVNAHNKQTLKKIIGPYQKLGIKFAMIADADVIRDKREFSDILQVTSDEQLKSQILQEREIIMKHFQVRNKYAVLYELQAKTKELAEQPLIPETADPDDIASALFDFRSNLKKLRDDSDELSEFKKYGRASLPSELQPNFDNLWKCCASEGLFIVNVGELESWMVDYDIERTSNKSKWISKALNKLFEIEYDDSKAIWKFVDALRIYLVS